MTDEKKTSMLFIPQHLVSQCGKVVEEEFLFFHVSTAQPAMCSTLKRRHKKKSRKPSIWQMCPDIWNLLLLSGCPVLHLSNLFIYSLSIHLLSNLHPAAKKSCGQPPLPPFLLCQTILPISFLPYFNVWHILSRSMVFIHSFILPNPPSSSLLLIFLSVCLSHFIRLTLHFPLPSIIVTPWLCLSIPNLWDWYIWKSQFSSLTLVRR